MNTVEMTEVINHCYKEGDVVVDDNAIYALYEPYSDNVFDGWKYYTLYSNHDGPLPSAIIPESTKLVLRGKMRVKDVIAKYPEYFI